MTQSARLLTVGHGMLGADSLADLLVASRVASVVDVRRYPNSRRDPSVERHHLGAVLTERGIGYRWDERLGGRRRLEPDQPVLDPWWTVEQFRAYAAHTRSAVFASALDQLLSSSADAAMAVMCSETVWWRCHRRLIADVAVVAHSTPVSHLMHDGSVHQHRVADGARLREDGMVVWDRLA